MPEPLLTANPDIAEGFKHGEFDLPDSLGATRLTIYEHKGGDLTLLISQRHGTDEAGHGGRFEVVSVLSNGTAELRRLLTRAHRERSR